MERKIEAAASHGVDCFLFDWYYYDDGPFLERCLEQGFLKAKNVEQIKFACMWANHDWENIHPAKRNQPRQVLYPGKITPETFERMTDLIIDRYFSHPSHLQINGVPFFSIYNLSLLVEGFSGSFSEVKRALDRFREKTIRAGFRGLHLEVVGFDVPVLSSEKGTISVFDAAESLGFNSIGNYVWIHFDVWSASTHFPGRNWTTDFAEAGRKYLSILNELQSRCPLPIYPNVTMGWDSSPRTVQSDIWEPGAGYPFTPILENNTPAAFQQALIAARDYASRFQDFSMITLNAWNEWTEGSYLEPEIKNSYGYLEAIKTVFSQAPRK